MMLRQILFYIFKAWQEVQILSYHFKIETLLRWLKGKILSDSQFWVIRCLIAVNAKKPSKHSFTQLFCSVDQIPFAQLLYNSIQWIGHYPKYKIQFTLNVGRRSSLMGSALDSDIERSGFRPWPGTCVVFLGKTLYSHGPENWILGVALRWTSIPSSGGGAGRGGAWRGGGK